MFQISVLLHNLHALKLITIVIRDFLLVSRIRRVVVQVLKQ